MVVGKRRGLQRFRDGEDPGEQVRLRLEASRIVTRQGDLDEARRLLQEAVWIDPGCAEAWLQLAWLTNERRERRALLRQVLALEPGHAQAQAELARLEQPSKPHRKATTGEGHHRRLVLSLLVLALVVFLVALLLWGPLEDSLAWLITPPTPTVPPTPTRAPHEIAAQFVPQLQAALSSGYWDRALEIVAIMQAVAPANRDVQQWALTTYMQCGRALVQAGEAAQAQIQFDQAAALAPYDTEALLWQHTTQLYLAGQAALQAGQWDVAIQSFTLAEEQMPNYGDLSARLLEAYQRRGQAAVEAQDWTTAIEAFTQAHEQAPQDVVVADLLASAYRQRGVAWQEQGKYEPARSDLEAALALRPDDAEAQAHLDAVMLELFPPKRIEINISTQRFYAWEGDTLVYKFLTSTGLHGRDTATGHFHVLDKIPMAYSSVWRLSMPYWLGIYYVGNIENGIHALPIRPDGSVMWGGLLGQRASYGCVILSTEAAALIYNWADIGTPVDIHY
jgi:tetratricopeptide (TPR) repeat protein